MSPKSDGRIAHRSEYGLWRRCERFRLMASLPPGELVSGDERASSSSPPPPSSHGGAPAHDVGPGQYATVIREMIRHENEVTNHRIMWLLIVQGLIANAYVGSAARAREKMPVLPLTGIVLTLSAFVLLYKSYHARGYLTYLGGLAKRGMLAEQQLPLMGWPDQRTRGWRNGQWTSRWLGRATYSSRISSCRHCSSSCGRSNGCAWR